jgi:formylglycine-generating enzyme required for sulfatase activity
MNSFSLVSLSVFLGAFSQLAAAQTINPLEAPLMEPEQIAGKMGVRFPTESKARYQIFRSYDLKGWEPAGNVINGTGGPLAVGPDVLGDKPAFFRIGAYRKAASVTLELNYSTTSGVSLRFPSEPGQTYVAYSSADFNNWYAFGDLIMGTGAPIELKPLQEGVDASLTIVETLELVPLPDMAYLKAATFRMGSPLEEQDRDLDEDPMTEVIFPMGFWMGKHEVTQREYERVMGSNPSWFKGDPRRPVEQVSWNDAMLFCAILTEIERAAGRLSTSFAYRLPTEAEFEFACRAGTSTRFSHGDDPDYSQLGEHAWYDGNSGATSHPVGERKENQFGLSDMHGNVWEWCLDWYQSRYPGGTVATPIGPASGAARVFRGGGWDYVGASCRSAYRNNVTPSRRMSYVGFRLVLAPNLLIPGL